MVAMEAMVMEASMEDTVATMASVRPKLSPRPMLMLNPLLLLIPTTMEAMV